jgi:GDP-4-dehydro-6-deoxy-D-mannose reductase
MSANVLITGITGFVGSHLAEHFCSVNNKGYYKVFGINRPRSSMHNIKHLLNDICLFECDMTDAHGVQTVIDNIRPDYIFHLAAQSYVPFSWSSPSDTFNNNVIGQINLLEAVSKICPCCRIQIACSSEEYGYVEQNELPIKETNPLRPLSPYAVSKVCQDLMGYQYFKSYGMHIVRTRAFNHGGPRRGEMFCESNFAKQIALIEAGKQEPIIKTGNLSSKRDYTDVRDIIKAYCMAISESCEGDVYNICSGNAISMQEVLDKLLSHTDMAIKHETDISRMRPSDVPVLLGDCSKFYNKTMWKPEISVDNMLLDLLNYWRDEVRK